MTMEKDDLVQLVSQQTDTIDELTQRIEELEAEIKDLRAAKLAELEDMRLRMEGHVDRLREFRERLDQLGCETRHQIELREDGWTIQHPLACRPNLFNCPFNEAARISEDILAHLPHGRYYCRLSAAGNILIEEPVT